MEPGKYGQKLENNVRFGNFDLFTWIKKNFDGAILGETTGKNYAGTGNNWNMSSFRSKRNNE